MMVSHPWYEWNICLELYESLPFQLSGYAGSEREHMPHLYTIMHTISTVLSLNFIQPPLG